MLKLQIGNGPVKIYSTDQEAYTDIRDGLTTRQKFFPIDSSKWLAKWLKHKDIVLKVLSDWVYSSDYFLIRLASGQARESKTYSNYLEIAQAVVGEAKSRPNLFVESNLAQDVMTNGDIGRNLSALMRKIHTKMSAPTTIWRGGKPVLKNHKGAYFLIAYKTYDFESVLSNPPDTPDVTLKVAVLHDVMDILKDKGPAAATQVPNGMDNCSTLVPNGVGGYTVNQGALGGTDGFRRRDDGTLIEGSGVISAARKKKMPLSCGPSYTTGRLMQMTHWAGGTVDEHTAMAWGIFAFWNKDYFTSFSGVHRFHEVMDMSKNYGVSYTPFEYPNASPVDAH